MSIDQIEIIVKGPTGCGKSGVMDTIIEAIKVQYGPHVQIASYDMSVERNLVGESLNQPDPAKVVFVVREENVGRPPVDTSHHCHRCPCAQCFRDNVGKDAVAVL